MSSKLPQYNKGTIYTNKSIEGKYRMNMNLNKSTGSAAFEHITM